MSKKWRLRILRFGISLLLAGFLWLSVKLVKEYNVEMAVPMAYDNSPSRFQLKEELPEELRLEVTGEGHLLFLPSIKLAYDSLRLDMSEQIGRDYLLTDREFRKAILRRLPDGVRVTRIRPDTLHLAFEEKIRKRLAVIPRLELNTRPGYYQEGPLTVVPDSVTILGPEEQLKDVNRWPTESLRVENVHRSRSWGLNLQPDKDLIFSPNRVLVQAGVRRYTERKIELPVEVVNLPLDEKIRILPEQVTVYALVPFDRAEQIEMNQFRVAVDAANLSPDQYYATLELLNSPEEVRSVRFAPRFVKFVRRSQGY